MLYIYAGIFVNVFGLRVFSSGEESVSVHTTVAYIGDTNFGSFRYNPFQAYLSPSSQKLWKKVAYNNDVYLTGNDLLITACIHVQYNIQAAMLRDCRDGI